MGCGSSTAAGAGSTLSKDPEDFHLEHMHFNKMKVPEFDVYLCDDLCPPVNKVVDIVNSINSCIDEVKDAAAIICGAFKLDIDLEGSADHDKLIVSLQKADGTHPTVEEAEKLYSDAKVAKADAELLKARKALHAAMEQSYVKLSLAGDVLSAAAPPAGLDAFNKALGEMKAAVGAAYKIVLVHKVAGVGGAPCVRVTLSKPVFPKGDPFSDDYTLEPVSLLDVVRCKEAKNIFAAEAAVAEGLGGLTKAVKAAEAAGLQVSFELKKKKLVAKMEGEPSEQVSKAKAAVRKALSTANGQLFKLQKAARNANGTINITKALVAVFESFKASAMKLAKGSTKLITANPKVKFSLDDGVDFDLGLKIDIPDFEGMDPLEIVRKVLPGPAKIVFDAVLGIKDIVVEMIPEFTTLAEQVTELVSKSEEVFAEPADKIKAAFGDDNSDPFAIPKAVATAAGNLKTVAVEPVKIVTCMKETIARLADEMTAAADEVKVLLA